MSTGGAEEEEVDVSRELELVVKAARGNKVEKVLSGCERILSVLPSDGVVLRTKCVCLLKKGRFEEGAAVAAAIGARGEEAYCAYRRGAAAEALELAAGGEDRLSRCVEAQARYKLGDFEGAARCYASLVNDSRPSVLANLLAAVAAGSCGEAAQSSREIARRCGELEAGKHYEACFNGACVLLERGLAAEALAVLERVEAAPSLAHHASATDARLVETLAAACLAATGRRAEARERCKRVLDAAKPTTAAQRHVACCAAHALYASRDGDEAFDSHKRLRPFAADVSASRRSRRSNAAPSTLLTPRQRAVGAVNWARLLLEMGKANEARDVLEGSPATAETELLAALCAVARQHADLLATLRRAREADLARPEMVKLCLARAQCLLDAGDAAAAAVELEAFAAETAALRSLVLEAAGDREGALRALDDQDAAAVAAHRLRLGDVERAAADLDDPVAKALATSWFDADAAERLALEIPDDEEEVDPEALLAQPLPRAQLLVDRGGKTVADVAETTATPRRRSAASLRRRRDKLKQAHLKKLEDRGDDPTRPPDPERWLPKKLRSYNKRGRRAKQQHNKFSSGAQGIDASARDVAKFDVAARKAAAEAAPPPINGHPKNKRRAKR